MNVPQLFAVHYGLQSPSESAAELSHNFTKSATKPYSPSEDFTSLSFHSNLTSPSRRIRVRSRTAQVSHGLSQRPSSLVPLSVAPVRMRPLCRSARHCRSDRVLSGPRPVHVSSFPAILRRGGASRRRMAARLSPVCHLEPLADTVSGRPRPHEASNTAHLPRRAPPLPPRAARRAANRRVASLLPAEGGCGAAPAGIGHWCTGGCEVTRHDRGRNRNRTGHQTGQEWGQEGSPDRTRIGTETVTRQDKNRDRYGHQTGQESEQDGSPDRTGIGTETVTRQDKHRDRYGHQTGQESGQDGSPNRTGIGTGRVARQDRNRDRTGHQTGQKSGQDGSPDRTGIGTGRVARQDRNRDRYRAVAGIRDRRGHWTTGNGRGG